MVAVAERPESRESCCNGAVMRMDERPIGMFDSGVGGLSVLREVRVQTPNESVLYLADQRWSPYGQRSLAEVQQRSIQVSGQLIEAGAKVVVVACNSASAAGLYALRDAYPEVPFVGLEPAVKPAARDSRTGVVGVLATAATFQGELFATVVDRHAADVRIVTSIGAGLSDMVEHNKAGTPEVKQLLTRLLEPLLDAGMDTLVLGCTHYPFLTADIRSVIGDQISLIDPAPAVARQVGRVIEQQGLEASGEGEARGSFATTGDPEHLGFMVEQLLAISLAEEPARW